MVRYHKTNFEAIFSNKFFNAQGGVDIMRTPVFDRPLLSPDIINLFENLDIDR